MTRAGIGYDIHRLVRGRRLILGGVEIPYTRGLEGHSDADVIVHAVCDALLGAIGAGDIGRHFPDDDPKYKDISSIELLKQVVVLLNEQGFKVNNIDATIVAEEPKITPFRDRMRKNIAEASGVEEGRINVKATTNERVGPIGKKEAIAAYAIASVSKG